MAVALQQATKNAIPVIHNVIKTQDYTDFGTKKEGSKRPLSVSIARTLKLFTDRHSKELVERHCSAVKKLTSAFTHGIYLKDVKLILEILKKCQEYISLDTRYEYLLCTLTENLSQPMLMEKASDAQGYFNDVVNALTELGIMAETSSDVIKVCICSTISKLYTFQEAGWASLDFKPVSRSFIKSVVERSGICKSVVECFAQLSNSSSKFVLIKAMQNLSNSSVNCNDMLVADAASQLCSNLSPSQASKGSIFLVVETLWNLLEYGSQESVADQLSCRACVDALQEMIIHQMKHCNSHADRQLRNDLLVIATLVITNCVNAPFAHSGFSRTLALFAAYPEVPSHSELLTNFNLKQLPEDFEMKRILMNILIPLSCDPDSVQMLSEQQVVLALFSFVQPIKEDHTPWSLAEYEELQLQALSVLSVIAPLCIDDYLACQGTTRLLILLDWCINSNDFGGHGNSFYGIGGRGSKRAQMRYCARLLQCMASSGDELVLQDMVDQGLLSQLICILDSSSSTQDENDEIDIQIQCDLLLIVASICESDIHRKELFGDAGVIMLVKFLAFHATDVISPLGLHKLVLAAADCIWSSILGCYMNEVTFLEREGAFFLLDLLEICPKSMRNVFLGTLLDLSENEKTMSHILLWRGKNDLTVGKLLVNIWTEEEEALGVPRELTGAIRDSSHPLLTQIQDSQACVSLPASLPSASIVDVCDNLRAKIYALFSKIGFNNVPGLTSPDYVTIAVIEHYLQFKTMEVWQEIKEELEVENVEPVSPDKECIEEILKVLENTGEKVAAVQDLLMKAEEDKVSIEEQEFYFKIKESHKQEEKVYQDFINYIDRTSNLAVLKQARQKQLEAIERSRLVSRGVVPKYEILHETVETKLQTTNFPGRQVKIHSTNFNQVQSTLAMEQIDHNDIVLKSYDI